MLQGEWKDTAVVYQVCIPHIRIVKMGIQYTNFISNISYIELDKIIFFWL